MAPTSPQAKATQTNGLFQQFCHFIHLVFLLLASLLLTLPTHATAATDTNPQPDSAPNHSAHQTTHVRLQLNWKHQFEFAGHYAAIEKGFYRNRGLEVELAEYEHGIDVVDEVVSGRVDYGLFSLQIIEERLKGQPITLLANYFKRYPLAILSQPGISTLKGLHGKRLMISDKDLDSSLMRYLFQQAGLVPGENLTVVPHSFTTQPFLDGKIDGLTAYLSNEPFELMHRGKAYQIIDLATTFPALGSNYLFTRETESTGLAERHQNFLEATNEGWRYALEHPDEIISLILEKYSQQKSREALQFEAEKTRNFIMPNAFPIGSIQMERLQAIADMLREMEVIQDTGRLDGFAPALTHAHTANTVQLTDEENAWITRHPRLRVANELDWPPYDFAIDGQPSGYSIDMIKLIAEKTGLRLEFVNGYNWDELLQMGREGKVDLFPAIWQTAEREAFLNFSSAYAETPHILLIREDDNRISSINDLNGRTLAGIKGYADIESIREHYPAIRIHEIANITEGLRAVAYGHADAYMGTLGAVSHALREQQISGLKILGETTLEGRLKTGEMHFATRKGLPLLAGIVQKGLDAVTREERMAIQNEWLFPLRTGSGAEATAIDNDSRLFWGVGIAVALALLALTTVTLLPRLISDDKLTRHIGSARFRSIVIIVLAVMVALVLLLVEQTLKRHHQQMLATTQNELEIVLTTASERIDDWEQEQKRYLSQLGRDAELIRLTKQLLTLPAKANTLAQSRELAVMRNFFVTRADEFGSTGFFIINTDGVSVGSRRDSNLGTTNLIAQQRPDLFQRLLTGEAVFVPPIESDVHIDAGSEKTTKRKPTTMFFAVPITDQDGTILALMTQRLRPEGKLSELMKYGRIGRSGESYAIDQYAQIVTSSRFVEQLIELGLLLRNEQEHGQLVLRDPGGELLKGFQPSVARAQLPLTRMAQALLNDSTQTSYSHQHGHISAITSDVSGYRDYRGVPVFGAWLWNSHLGLGITTEIDVDEALAGYYSLRHNLFIITGLTLLLAIAAVGITLVLAGRATTVLKRSHSELEGLVEERTAGLKQATIEAQEANRSKSEFLSSMSHELRTPLNAILGFSQLLESEENLTTEQTESVQDIIRAGSHLLELINEVLDLSKIEAGKLELSIEPVPLNNIMSACHKLIAPMAEQHNITLTLGDGCLSGHSLRADYTRTKQVLLNLLSNAIKYNRAHGSVTVSCRRQDEKLRIEVRDTGPGIPAHKLDKLFEAFNRLGAESGTIEGTGIGLVITRQLVKMMDGELGVESIEGEGSTFWFTLPWLEQKTASTSVSPAPQKVTREAAHLKGQQKVLYIEDNPVNLKLVEKLIAKQTSLQLISAEEPIAGIEMALSEKPDLILLDINLPTMSGYEVAKKLRTMDETKATPIIALTANAMPDDIAKGEEAGFDYYLTKPIQIKAFLEVLHRYLGE